jgi:pimeloyl-ACP methyl ester carboxylesterase
MPYKLLDDKKTYANVNSENPTVCFLHGWGRSSQDFNSISQSFDYISFDLPGFGKSLEPINSMTPKEYADYINQYIPNSVDTIVGHSFGGRIAVHLSELRDVRNLILVGVPLIKKQIHSKKLSILNIYKSLNKFGILSDQMIEKIKKIEDHTTIETLKEL